MKASTIFAGVFAALATGVMAVPAPAPEAAPATSPAEPATLHKRVMICDPKCNCNGDKRNGLGWRSCCDVGGRATTCYPLNDCKC
ncbi:hypothetical protein OQA88_1081 [Cercophora sp. LCS_1]